MQTARGCLIDVLYRRVQLILHAKENKCSLIKKKIVRNLLILARKQDEFHRFVIYMPTSGLQTKGKTKIMQDRRNGIGKSKR
jgi:hypothetical protein